MDKYNWDMISAIGQCFGALATFFAVVVALVPYRKNLEFEFTLSRNLHNKPMLIIWNNSVKGKLIRTVWFYSGHPSLMGQGFWGIDYIDNRDDLASTTDTVYVAPGSVYQLEFNCIRIFHDYSHSGLKLKLCRNVYIEVRDSSGKKYLINSKYTTKDFLDFIRNNSPCYRESPIGGF